MIARLLLLLLTVDVKMATSERDVQRKIQDMTLVLCPEKVGLRVFRLQEDGSNNYMKLRRGMDFE